MLASSYKIIFIILFETNKQTVKPALDPISVIHIVNTVNIIRFYRLSRDQPAEITNVREHHGLRSQVIVLTQSSERKVVCNLVLSAYRYDSNLGSGSDEDN